MSNLHVPFSNTRTCFMATLWKIGSNKKTVSSSNQARISRSIPPLNRTGVSFDFRIVNFPAYLIGDESKRIQSSLERCPVFVLFPAFVKWSKHARGCLPGASGGLFCMPLVLRKEDFVPFVIPAFSSRENKITKKPKARTPGNRGVETPKII